MYRPRSVSAGGGVRELLAAGRFAVRRMDVLVGGSCGRLLFELLGTVQAVLMAGDLMLALAPAAWAAHIAMASEAGGAALRHGGCPI